jgi:lambda repressor-like predicted transcriptional regulator
MHHNDRRRYEMLVRVRDFGATYGHLFPESTLAPQAFAAVTTAVDDMETADVAETTASVSVRATRKQDARRALQERLLLIVKTAQVLPGTEPAFKAHFRVPASRNDQQLLTTARQCGQRAAPVTEQFVAHGMSPTFLSDLDALIERFEEALRDRGMSRDQLVEARGRSRQALANALQAIGQLDVMVANHLAADPIVREVWKRSRRVAYPAKARRASATDPGGAAAASGPEPAVPPAPAPA